MRKGFCGREQDHLLIRTFFIGNFFHDKEGRSGHFLKAVPVIRLIQKVCTAGLQSFFTAENVPLQYAGLPVFGCRFYVIIDK